MHVIVGLGNPGRAYARHRHNVGFQILDLLATRSGLTFDRRRHDALLADGQIAGQRVLLAKPQTYMNLSGRSVSSLCHYFRVPDEKLLVINDDLDLPVGALRLRPGGGAGGQNGLKSIIEWLGTQTIPRLRVGIGRPPGRMAAATYVLRNFNSDEEEIMEVVREQAADVAESWLRDGIEQAMNQYNERGAGAA